MLSLSFKTSLCLLIFCLSVVSASICCQAETAECSACKKEMTIEEFCMKCVSNSGFDQGCSHCSEEKLTTPCLIRSYLSSGIIGMFVPSCEQDGSFSATQCHGSTGMCWCVNEQGVEIDGTRKQPGSPRPDCKSTKDSLTLCQKAAQDTSITKLVGAFIPKCESDGSYTSMQCHGSTGMCWCVNKKDGSEIVGTRSFPGKPLPKCDTANTAKSVADGPVCCKALSAQCLSCAAGITVEEFCLQCANDGHKETGCSDCLENGLSTRCLIISSLATGAIGEFVPKCDKNGEFLSRQYHASTGMSWCVDSQGVEISGTRTSAGQPQVKCAGEVELTKCQKELSLASSSKIKMVGSFVPKCESDGSYSKMQCHGSTGMCWCVDQLGNEISGTRNTPGSPNPQCVSSSLKSAQPQIQTVVESQNCQSAAEKVKSLHLRGSYIPQCEEDGTYSTLQCHGSTGHCWCAEPSTGKEIEGTRRTPGQVIPDCSSKDADKVSNSSMTPCQKLSSSGVRAVGGFRPKCEADGSFSSTQCHGSTGYCWCVDEQGVEINGTRAAPGHFSRNCSAERMPVCLRHLALASSKKLIGGFTPACDESGLYKSRQCHASTGMCWCVDLQGKEIKNTRTKPSDDVVDCDNARLTKCQKESKKTVLLGAFVPKCEDDGSYTKKQCHGSTGYCWCVDPQQGTELLGTRSAVGVQLTC